MPAGRGVIVIPVTGDTNQLVRELKKATAELEKLGVTATKDAARAHGALSRLGSAGSALKSKLLGPLQGLGPALSVAGIVSFGKSSVTAFKESERANAELQNTLRNNPKLAGESTAAYEKLAHAIQNKTVADDESVISAAAVLGNFNITGKQIRGLLPLVVDYARKTGTDVPGAAQIVGKAMLGNARALKEVGINFKSTGNAGKDFTAIQGLINAKVGGFAVQEGAKASSRIDIMKNKINDLQEVVGGKLTRAFGFLIDHLNVIGPLLGMVAAGWVTYKALSAAATLQTIIFGEASSVAWLSAAGPIALVVAAIAGVAFVIFKFRKQIVGALGAVAGAFKAAGEWIMGVFSGVWSFLKRWGTLILIPILGPIPWIIQHWSAVKEKIVGVFSGIVGKVKQVFGGLATVIKAPLNLIIDSLNFLIGALNKIHFKIPSWVPGVGGKGFGIDIPKIPHLAAGGIARAGHPTLAVFGEGRYDEAIVPLRPGAGMGITNIVNVTVEGSVMAEKDLARTIRDHLVHRGLNGGVGFVVN